MQDERKVWLNGELVPWEKATVPLLSHGFSRGSAFFEVFGVHCLPDGPAAFRMDDHLDRLMKSARLLGMTMAYSKDQIAAAVRQTVEANRLGRGLIKILAYWGEEAVINLVLESKLDLAIFAIPASDELGLDRVQSISACLSPWRKIHPATVPVEAKSCANYLNGYLARRDANLRGFDVGLMVGTDGFLAEGSIESLFVVKDDVLKTPPKGRILDSITRRSLLEAAAAIGIATSEEALLPAALDTADELFTCHTGIKVLPIDRYETRRLEAPGPVSRKLMQLMDDIINFRDDRFRHWFSPLG